MQVTQCNIYIHQITRLHALINYITSFNQYRISRYWIINQSDIDIIELYPPACNCIFDGLEVARKP